MTDTPSAVAPEATATTKTKLAPPVKRLFGLIAPVNIVLYAIVSAIPGIFLPLQLEAIDPARKAQHLGVITGVAAAVVIVASPVLGVLSDRTRSRFGRRTPWMVGGALLAGLSLVFMGVANGIAQLFVGWIMVQVSINFIFAPLAALLPERVPVAARGVFSTLAGLGLMLGTLGGSIYGAAMAKNLSAGYLVLPGALIIIVALFVVLAPDASSKAQVNERFSFAEFLKVFWVSPRRHPDFAWGFWGRILLFTGYFLIQSYALYILQDYIGLGGKAVALSPKLSLVTLVAALIALAIAGPLSDRIRRRKPIVIAAALIIGIGMLVPFFLPTVGGMLVFAFLSGFGFGAYLSVDAALMSEILPSEDTFAKDLGVLNIAATLPQSIGPLIGSLVVVSVGYAPLFPIALVLAVVGALCILPIKAVR